MKISKNFISSNKFEILEKEWKDVQVSNFTIISIPGFLSRADNDSSATPAVHVRCVCEKELITSFYRVKNGKTISCGCHNSNYKEGDKGNAYDLMNRYKYSAKKRNFSFDLEFDAFYNIIKQNCHYCNIEPKQSRIVKRCKETVIYNGIDRIDSKEGYKISNCVACCFTCNRAKSDMSYDQFIEYLNRVSNYSPHIKNRDVTVKPKSLSRDGNTVSTTDEVVFVEHSNCALNRSNNVTKSSRNNDCC